MTPLLFAHDANCPAKGLGHTDAAKRVSDTYRLHKSALGAAALGRWLAVALADGTSDGQLYDRRREAVTYQHHNEQFYAFVCITPGDMSVCEAEGFLQVNRMLYDKGLRMTDPDHHAGGREVIRRSAREDDRSLMRSIASGGRLRPSNLIITRD